MNIFEDLIDELKEENLLEETVTETSRAESQAASETVENQTEKEFEEENGREIQAEFSETELSDAENENAADNFQTFAAAISTLPHDNVSSQVKSVNQTDFFRKRAGEEVTGLQLVEHIFSGIERQQKKMMPKPYDDLKVKKALHEFLQISGDVNSPEHAQSEFQLMQETESWYSALSHRDKQISVTHLRRYCETTKPVLSSQALITLARFYRNSPYSEAVRSKFDLIVTRLFSKDLYNDKREISFERDELINHLAELYAEWESVSLYSNEEDESEITLAAFKFEDFMSEAEKADSFDELIRNDFFNRLRSFKESAGEQFFAPLLTATAVESNVRIGNRYIELLEKEREKGEFEKLENKYGFLHDQVISDATSKTLQLVELLKGKVEKTEKTPLEKPKRITKTETPKVVKEKVKNEKFKSADYSPSGKSNFFADHKWLLTAAAVVLAVSAAIYIWGAYRAAPEKILQDAKKVNLDNSSLKEYIKEARIGNDTFFAVVQPSWNSLSQQRKEEILNKIQLIGNEKGFKKVHLLNMDGKTAGAVSNGVVEVKN